MKRVSDWLMERIVVVMMVFALAIISIGVLGVITFVQEERQGEQLEGIRFVGPCRVLGKGLSLPEFREQLRQEGPLAKECRRQSRLINIAGQSTKRLRRAEKETPDEPQVSGPRKGTPAPRATGGGGDSRGSGGDAGGSPPAVNPSPPSGDGDGPSGNPNPPQPLPPSPPPKPSPDDPTLGDGLGKAVDGAKDLDVPQVAEGGKQALDSLPERELSGSPQLEGEGDGRPQARPD